MKEAIIWQFGNMEEDMCAGCCYKGCVWQCKFCLLRFCLTCGRKHYGEHDLLSEMLSE